MSRVCMLTTIDNPFNPFDNYESWEAFDIQMNHNCNSLLAKHALVAPDFTENEFHAEIERAIDEIIETDPELIYKKLVKEE